MNKKLLLAIVLLLILAGVFVMRDRVIGTSTRGAEEIPNVESALPDVSNYDSFEYIKVVDTESLSYSISELSGFINFVAGKVYGSEFEDANDVESFLSFMEDFIEMTDELALIAVSSDVPEFYLSFYADDDKFDSFVSDFDSRIIDIEPWETEDAKSGDAWIVRPLYNSRRNANSFYMTRRKAGGKSFALLSSSESGIDRMARALNAPSERYKPSRQTEGENVLLGKFKEPFEMGPYKITSSETGWARLENGFKVDIFSDLYSGSVAMFASQDITGVKPTILGDGELAFFAAAYIPFYLHAVFPGEDDPVGALFDVVGAGAIPAEFSSDLKEILSQARISAVLTVKDEEPNTAYIVIESGAKSSLDKLYSLASIFLRSNEIELQGWDSAYFLKLGGGEESIFAHKEGAVLLGIGKASDYAKIPSISNVGELDDISSPSTMMGVILEPTSLKGEFADAFKQSFRREFNNQLSQSGIPEDIFDGIQFDMVEKFNMRQTLTGHTYINVFFKKPEEARID
ncbi:MAG: hypothetical protein LBQ58_03420 [Synergistaceae bacterium]|nr:hypothetical protein [Synergistaceae bacterium]